MKLKFFAIIIAALMFFAVIACGCSKSSDKSDDVAHTETAAKGNYATAETAQNAETQETVHKTDGLSDGAIRPTENTGDVVPATKGTRNEELQPTLPEDNPTEVTGKEITEVEMDFADFE